MDQCWPQVHLRSAIDGRCQNLEYANHLRRSSAQRRGLRLPVYHAGAQDERLAAIKDLQVTVVAKRKALTQDLEEISLKVVDHAFWRAAQLLAAVLVLLAIGLVWAVIVFKRTRTPNP